MISSYQAAQKHMGKARNPSAGRTMASWHWRLHQNGDEYVVTVHEVQVGRFLPDNTFVFDLTSDRAYPIAQTMSSAISRNLPFEWKRYGKANYRVDYWLNIKASIREHFTAPTSAPQLYKGLRFDLRTGECLNYRSDMVRRVIPERRREWLAASKAWKQKLRAAARLGVFDRLAAAERLNRTPWTERTRWNSEQGLDILYKAIKDNDCNATLLQMFVATVPEPWVHSSPQIYEYVEKIINNQSTALRQRFGVFEEGPENVE